jgi:hypothetical protein
MDHHYLIIFSLDQAPHRTSKILNIDPDPETYRTQKRMQIRRKNLYIYLLKKIPGYKHDFQFPTTQSLHGPVTTSSIYVDGFSYNAPPPPPPLPTHPPSRITEGTNYFLQLPGESNEKKRCKKNCHNAVFYASGCLNFTQKTGKRFFFCRSKFGEPRAHIYH